MWCVDVLVSLSLVFLKLEIGKIQGVASGEPLKHLITPCGKFLVSRKFAIRDEPNVWLRCSSNVKRHLFYR